MGEGFRDALLDGGPQEGRVTIGVAIPVPAPHAEELQRWRAEFGDPLAWAIPAHVTLVPPTPVSTQDLGQVREHLSASAAAVQPFAMCLRGTSTFRPVSPVVFVQIARGISDIERLEDRVRSGPLARELTFPFHPHVTVAHDVPGDMLDLAYAGLAELHAEFRVDSFTEFEQLPDGAWAVAREYPLTGPPR